MEMQEMSEDYSKVPSNEGTAGGKKKGPSAEMLRAMKMVEYFAEHPYFVVFMAVLTMWALYGSDIKLAASPGSADLGFEVIMTVVFFMFVIEIILQCFYKEDYMWFPDWEALPEETPMYLWMRRLQFGSFYFWLDFIATFSIILELQWILGESYIHAINGSGTQSASAGRASDTGERAGRIVRLIRMVRLVRLIKLYKYATATRRGGAEERSESRVGAAMSDLTNRRVIVLILMMLIVIPLLTVSDSDVSLSLGVQFVHHLAMKNATDPTTFSSGLTLAVSTVIDQLPVLSILVDGVSYAYDEKVSELRDVELRVYELNTEGFTTQIIYDLHNHSREAAFFSMYTTSFVIVLLIAGTYFFSSDVNRLVIGPIERLVDLVRKISANPLGVEYKMMGAKEGFLDGMETTVLLTTITKIGGLMRVGFGEAGAAVIAKNLGESSGGRLNLMGAGTMIHSIFGFCDVRQFTDTTECLQEEVMLFVNRIAHILHSIVVQCSGSANKNIGDAFLLTWKLDDKLNPEQVSALADQALLAFCKSLIELGRYQEFICNFSVAATARLYKRFPDYNVRIGSGLHVGWAIEGAIGSHRKIDASYLSPHVNNTEYLESSTKQYGVALLLSEPFYRLLSPAASKYCRQVDRIRRSDFEDPMGLFTFDTDLDIDWNDNNRHKKKINIKNKLLSAAKRAQSTMSSQKAKVDMAAALAAEQKAIHFGFGARKLSTAKRGSILGQARGRRQSTVGMPMGQDEMVLDDFGHPMESDADIEAKEQRKKEAPNIILKKYAQTIWVTDPEVVELRHKVNDAFRALWEQGIHAYIKGDWRKAKDIFQETYRQSKKKDGPSKFLMEIIDENKGMAPQEWPGYRDDY
mmetsp:Transcript_28112/g.63688  ORF Transcript_28112/g.63688 Transcript_28112/m.63688 type:complete len:862 (+) Transcript_28112:138-2723(+)